MTIGRYAPSPSGRLHIGNLRTALLAWLAARAESGSLLLRIDDLDIATSRPEHEQTQRDDLAALGLSFDSEARQSSHGDLYREAIATLDKRGLLYPCFCSRREIREATVAPHDHLPDGAYPGTCRELSVADRHRRAAERPAALRVRAGGENVSFNDLVAGPFVGTVDDFVVSRNDGAPAYNLATVVDDHHLGVTQVLRGADLLVGTPRQVWLRRQLGLGEISHAHVSLMVNADGDRLAKRDGAVTLPDLEALGYGPLAVRNMLAASIGLIGHGESATLDELVELFNFATLSSEPTVFTNPDDQTI